MSAAAENDTAENVKYRVRRNGDGGKRSLWSRGWMRALLVLLLIGFVAITAFWIIFINKLPDARALLQYEPPLPTMVRDIHGEPIHSYARERRVQLQYADFPPLLVRAYLSAEDKTFFQHHGVDLPGMAGAVFDYVSKMGTGQRAKGGSTITQQVAKNLLIGDAYSPVRKIKEAILAYRMENVLTKQQILELYLNQIYLGRNAYGVQAAARAYFDKDVGQLNLPQMAYLAILPKGPANYRPEDNHDRAIARRNWVLGEMHRNGWIDESQMRQAQAAPLGAVRQRGDQFKPVAPYFVEEVRRRLIDLFGETAEDGPHSVYAGGLWVRTSLDETMQTGMEKALRDGLIRYDRGRGWSGPIGTIDTVDDKWQSRLAGSNKHITYEDWRVALVLSKEGSSAQIGFADGETSSLPSSAAAMPKRGTGTAAFRFLKVGDLIAVAPQGDHYALRSVPGVSGGMVAQNPHNGRIYAMQGGFDYYLSSFNRATQAQRQPGSTIKPFVYATALDNGMTPSTIIVDGPFCVYQSSLLGQKCFKNNEGGYAGPQTIRWAVEQSRNLMTVRTASQIGMPKVVKTIKTMGIGDYKPYLSYALGAGETTVEKMVNGFSMLVNHGRELKPTVIDFVQDRHGKVIWPKNWRPCQGCNMPDWNGKAMPRFAPDGRQLMNPITAYQTVHIMEGVVQRGTATVVRDLDRPLMGKTGTTTGPTNVWFIGGSPDLIAGVYVGYDTPRNLGAHVYGGTLSAPIWKQFMKPVLKDMPKVPFIAPAGTRMVTVDRRSGRRVYGVWPSNEYKPAVIWEAFKAETEPRRSLRKEEIGKANAPSEAAKQVERRNGSDAEFLSREGGIY